jgi:hypothetical protein
MRTDLHPLLAALYRALHNPDNLRAETASGHVAHWLDVYIVALKSVFEAATQLKLKVFESASCRASTRLVRVAAFSSAMNDLTQVYGAVLTQLAAQPGDNHLIRLEHNQRANLQRLAMWLADMQLAIAHPRRILLEGDAVGETSRAMLFKLHLSYPDDLAELETFVDTPTGYDAGHVLAVLSLERDDRSSERYVPQVAAKPAAAPALRRGLGGSWLVPLAIGWIIGNWLFDDDDDRDCRNDDAKTDRIPRSSC